MRRTFSFAPRLPLSLVLTAFCATFCIEAAHPAYAQSDQEHASIAQVVRLESGSGCGTGVMLQEGYVLTAHHVVAQPCVSGECVGLSIHRAPRVGSPATELVEGTPKMLRSSPAFDLALLQVDSAAQGEPQLPTIPMAPGATLFSYSFPGCGALTLTSGAAEDTRSPLVKTSLLGSFGSSGAPVFDEQGALVGMADQAAEVVGAIRARVSGTPFSLRVVTMEAIAAILSAAPELQCTVEAEQLVAHYQHQVQQHGGVRRALMGLEFLKTARTLLPCAGHEGFPRAALAHVLQRGSSLDYLLAAPFEDSRTMRAFESLVLSYNLEEGGPYLAPLQRIHPQRVSAALARSGRPQAHLEHLEQLLSSAASSRYPGLEMFGWVATLLLLALGVAWGASAGAVFATTQGGLLRRLGVTLFAQLVLWPVSLLFLGVARRRPTRRKRTSSPRA